MGAAANHNDRIDGGILSDADGGPYSISRSHSTLSPLAATQDAENGWGGSSLPNQIGSRQTLQVREVLPCQQQLPAQ